MKTFVKAVKSLSAVSRKMLMFGILALVAVFVGLMFMECTLEVEPDMGGGTGRDRHAYEDEPLLGGGTGRDRHAYTLRDPLAAFERLKQNNKGRRYSIYFSGGPGGFDAFSGYHIQSYAYYDDHNIMAQNGRNRGTLYFSNHKNGKMYDMLLPETMNHPGGMQVIGDYLVMPTQRIEGHGHPVVLLYDLRPLHEDKNPSGPTWLFFTNGGEQSAGITDLNNYVHYYGYNNENEFWGTHLIGVVNSDRNVLEIYYTNTDHLSNTGHFDGQHKWSHVADIRLRQRSHYDGMSLVRDKNNDIWMFGFYGEPIGSKNVPSGFTSHVDLIKLTEDANYTYNGRKRFHSAVLPHGSLQLNISDQRPSIWAVSTRWGTGMRVYDNDNVYITITERNTNSETSGWTLRYYAAVNDFVIPGR